MAFLTAESEMNLAAIWCGCVLDPAMVISRGGLVLLESGVAWCCVIITVQCKNKHKYYIPDHAL